MLAFHQYRNKLETFEFFEIIAILSFLRKSANPPEPFGGLAERIISKAHRFLLSRE
jgi:hypothetical protein